VVSKNIVWKRKAGVDTPAIDSKADEPEPRAVPFEKATKAALVSMAVERGLDNKTASEMKKSDLAAYLSAEVIAEGDDESEVHTDA
jgi:hypothetical protein